ncbi:MAG: hypothetical protein JWM76_609 [Pseudonocardiales bacterium]|nr:hypothetical protein [Pseudonocardiales bacterium]
MRPSLQSRTRGSESILAVPGRSDGAATVKTLEAAIREHWRASERGDTRAEHEIYSEDAVLDYPQSGERFRGRRTIAAQRSAHPADRHFRIMRITGLGVLWVSECIITYDGVPTFSFSAMQFVSDKVAHETQYFADPFGAPPWRLALAEPMPGRQINTS